MVNILNRATTVLVLTLGSGVDGFTQGFEFAELSRADVCRPDRAFEPLREFANDGGPGLFGKGFQFAVGVAVVVIGVRQANGGDDGAFGLDVELGAFLWFWHFRERVGCARPAAGVNSWE